MIEALITALLERQRAFEPFMSLSVVSQNKEKTCYTLRLLDQGTAQTFTLTWQPPVGPPHHYPPELVRITGHQRNIGPVDILMSPIAEFVWPVLLEI